MDYFLVSPIIQGKSQFLFCCFGDKKDYETYNMSKENSEKVSVKMRIIF